MKNNNEKGVNDGYPTSLCFVNHFSWVTWMFKSEKQYPIDSKDAVPKRRAPIQAWQNNANVIIVFIYNPLGEIEKSLYFF